MSSVVVEAVALSLRKLKNNLGDDLSVEISLCY